MSKILNLFPGQICTVFLDTLDGYGSRKDPTETPFISRIIFPGLTLAEDYPQDMLKIDTGLYYYQFTLPTGASAVGSYLVDISYLNTDTDLPNSLLYQIIVQAPYGNYSASVSI